MWPQLLYNNIYFTLSYSNMTDVAATDLIEEMVKTAALTFDPSKHASELIEEFFPGSPEDVPTETLYRK